MKILDTIGDIIFWIIWIPICIILITAVVITAYTQCLWNYIKSFFKKNDR